MQTLQRTEYRYAPRITVRFDIRLIGSLSSMRVWLITNARKTSPLALDHDRLDIDRFRLLKDDNILRSHFALMSTRIHIVTRRAICSEIHLLWPRNLPRWLDTGLICATVRCFLKDEAYRDRAYISGSENSTLVLPFALLRAANDDKLFDNFTKQILWASKIKVWKENKVGGLWLFLN